MFAHKSTCKCSPGVLTSCWPHTAPSLLSNPLAAWHSHLLGRSSVQTLFLPPPAPRSSFQPWVLWALRGRMSSSPREEANPGGVDVPRLQRRRCRWRLPKREHGPLREGLQSTFLAPAGEGKGLCKPGGGVERRPAAAPGQEEGNWLPWCSFCLWLPGGSRCRAQGAGGSWHGPAQEEQAGSLLCSLVS